MLVSSRKSIFTVVGMIILFCSYYDPTVVIIKYVVIDRCARGKRFIINIYMVERRRRRRCVGQTDKNDKNVISPGNFILLQLFSNMTYLLSRPPPHTHSRTDGLPTICPTGAIFMADGSLGFRDPQWKWNIQRKCGYIYYIFVCMCVCVCMYV